MTMNPLPPQAYTKDTLTKAYHWLLHQSPSIREMAATPDILVSLYLKAQRNGEESLERPSIQNFKNELKSLAGLMGELEQKPISHTAPSPTPAQAPAQPSPQPPVYHQPPSQHHQTTPAANHNPPAELLGSLDPKSRAMIGEVKEHLNLGSEVEVLRLLISLGYHKARTLYTGA